MQRHDVPRTTSGSSLTPRLLRTHHVPASLHAAVMDNFTLATRTCRMLHRPLLRRAANSEKVVACAKIRGRSACPIVTTRRAHREGRNLRPVFSRTFHVPASRRAMITERVVTVAQNLEDAPRASERIVAYAHNLNFQEAPCWHRCEDGR